MNPWVRHGHAGAPIADSVGRPWRPDRRVARTCARMVRRETRFESIELRRHAQPPAVPDGWSVARGASPHAFHGRGTGRCRRATVRGQERRMRRSCGASRYRQTDFNARSAVPHRRSPSFSERPGRGGRDRPVVDAGFDDHESAGEAQGDEHARTVGPMAVAVPTSMLAGVTMSVASHRLVSPSARREMQRRTPAPPASRTSLRRSSSCCAAR